MSLRGSIAGLVVGVVGRTEGRRDPVLRITRRGSSRDLHSAMGSMGIACSRSVHIRSDARRGIKARVLGFRTAVTEGWPPRIPR